MTAHSKNVSNVAGRAHENAPRKDSIDEYNNSKGDAADVIKSRMFEYVNISATIPELLRSQDFDGIAQDIISACYDDALSTCNTAGLAAGILATGILHYTLTRALIKSQRNITHHNVEVDIAIPDAKTLDADPHRALLICVIKTLDVRSIQNTISDAMKIQPVRENIWVVLPQGGTRDKIMARIAGVNSAEQDGSNKIAGVRIFEISKDKSGFAKMLSEIGRFVNYGGSKCDRGASNLRILGS